jgi:hypothetical protein
MKLKDIFVGFANLFKQKDAKKNSNYDSGQDRTNNPQSNYGNYEEIMQNKQSKINMDRLDKEEINFEKLKTISEHAAMYNEKQNNEMIIEERISENIIENTLEENKKENPKIRSVTIQELQNEINTIWDILKIKENTQAEHIIKSTPSDKWVTMDEIRNNIKIQFNVEYSNEKSLYPYLKTLVDIDLIRVNNQGKKRTWKRNVIVIKNKK